MARERGGLTIENRDFMPVRVVVGRLVYISQGEDDDCPMIVLEHGPAQKLADAITLALASPTAKGPGHG